MLSIDWSLKKKKTIVNRNFDCSNSNGQVPMKKFEIGKQVGHCLSYLRVEEGSYLMGREGDFFSMSNFRMFRGYKFKSFSGL